MSHCARCQASVQPKEVKLSWFTGDPVCPECSRIEKGAPNFQQAHLHGLESYAAGGEIYGVGFTEEDWQFLQYIKAPKRRAHARQP